MGVDVFADRESVLGCLAVIEAAHDRLAGCSFDGFSSEELVAVLARREVVARRAPAVDHRILGRLVADGNPGALGAASLSTALAERLRIGATEARRRLCDAADLGPRTSVTGQPLEPVLPNLAAAQAAGCVGAEHVETARKAYSKIPATVAAPDRARAERDLAALARQFGPEAFRKLADHLVAVLDPDGDFTDRERRARRGVRISRQHPDGMSVVNAKITPELRAALEPLMAKLAAPGMCNPADEHPCVRGTPTEEQIRSDNRTTEQRQHDALLAICRIVLCTDDLGQLNGLPVTVIVTTTLAELQAAAGCAELGDANQGAAERAEPDAADRSADSGRPVPTAAVPAAAVPAALAGKALTAGGTVLPMSDLLRMASHAIHYLAIFDGNGRALWLGRAKRIASADQRIALHARDHGCTRPGCTVSGYLTQVHHLEHDWADDGETNIDTLGLACAPDNRMATEQNWLTRLGDNGRVEWIPPPELERGQPRTNPYHFIEDLIDYYRPRDTEPPQKPDESSRAATSPPAPEPDCWADHPPPDWADDPLPGDPEYDQVLNGLDLAYIDADTAR